METIGNYKEYYKIAYNPAYLKAGFLILSLSNIILLKSTLKL